MNVFLEMAAWLFVLVTYAMFLGRQRRPYIVSTFRYSYGFMLVYMYVNMYISVIANGGTGVLLYRALSRL